MSTNIIRFAQATAFTRNGMAVLDKNDKPAVYLNGIGQPIPERGRVVSGTIAESVGIQPGEFYCITFKSGEYQGNITWTPVAVRPLTIIETMQMSQILEAQSNVEIVSPKVAAQTTGFVAADIDMDEEF